MSKGKKKVPCWNNLSPKSSSWLTSRGIKTWHCTKGQQVQGHILPYGFWSYEKLSGDGKLVWVLMSVCDIQYSVVFFPNSQDEQWVNTEGTCLVPKAKQKQKQKQKKEKRKERKEFPFPS